VGVLEYALSLARDLAHSWPSWPPSILSECNSSINPRQSNNIPAPHAHRPFSKPVLHKRALHPEIPHRAHKRSICRGPGADAAKHCACIVGRGVDAWGDDAAELEQLRYRDAEEG
jgi:hypothetical protein